MSEHPADDGIDVGRRTFMKASGAAAGAGILGLGASGTAAASGSVDTRLLNWRRIEARKVWDRGYRGHPERTLGILDSGLSGRHPDLGPWNEVLAGLDDEGNFQLADASGVEYPDPSKDEEVTHLATLESSGTIGPGVTDAGVVTRQVIVEFVPDETHDTDAEANQVDATLTWTPQEEDNELVLEKLVDESWTEVAASTNFNPLTGAGETITTGVEPTASYRLVIETYANVAAQYELTADVNNVYVPDQADPEFDFTDPDQVDVFGFVDDDTAGPMPKIAGWYNQSSQFGDYQRPRDPNGHGSHCAGIMAGTGRASAIDHANTAVEEPRALLLPGDFIEYDIDGVASTSTVFVSALGDNVVLELLYDEEIVHTSYIREDSIIVDEPAVHGSGEDSYTVRVRPVETRQAAPVAGMAQEGNPTVGRLNQIALGSYVPPAEVTEGARSPDGPQTVHPGMAPDASLVGLSGYGSPTQEMGDHAGTFADVFNMRAVNMSFGYPQGLPLGAFGGALDSLPHAVRQIADGGILPVAAAGNFMTPANGNGSPAGMEEAISVAATGPLDGLTPYSAGGIGTLDEDENDVDRKPDVTAPGGDADDYALLFATAVAGLPYPIPSRLELVRSVLAADPDTVFSEADPPRDYDNAGGTSMASPYTCGTAGLVAQAMEFDAPETIALPEPADAELSDVMRLKQVLLATANETVFTAAPYHAGKSPPSAPVYTHGGRDPYEGFGRVNPDAAVDAVSRNLLGEGPADRPELGGEVHEATSAEAVGTFVPEDSRAVAGYVTVPGGQLDVSVEFTGYTGANRGMAAGSPHLDLFVYDAESPGEHGAPNVVASDQGEQGSASASVSVDRGTRDHPTERTFYVVAKIVNIPGVVNGFDCQATFDLGVTFDPAAAFPPIETDLTATGSRADDGDVFTGGQTNKMQVTIADFQHADEVRVRDQAPPDWTVDEEFGDVASVDDDNTVHFEPTVTEAEVADDGSVTFTYFAEAPQGVESTGQYTFGPARAEVVVPDVPEEDSDGDLEGEVAEFAGTDTATVAGASTET